MVLQARLLSVTSSYPPELTGGAELVAHRHNVALSTLGLECAAFAGSPANSTAAAESGLRRDVYQDIPVWRLPRRGADASGLRENFRNAQAEQYFTQVLEVYAPSIVHFHSLQGLSVNLVKQAAAYGAKTLFTVHDHWGFCHRQTLTKPNGLLCSDTSECHHCQPLFVSDTGENTSIQERNRLVRTALTGVDMLISPSLYLRRCYVEQGLISADRSRIICNGIEERFFRVAPLNLTRRPLRFGFLGALSEHKGVGLILDALCEADQRPDWEFRFAGFGPMTDNLKRFQRNHPNGSKVRFDGEISPEKTEVFFENIDVLAAPSLWPENQPLSILEAMGSARPVIALTAGGVPELVEHEISGHLMADASINALIEGMAKYMRNPSLAATQGIAARKQAQSWTMAATTARIVKLYSRLLRD